MIPWHWNFWLPENDQHMKIEAILQTIPSPQADQTNEFIAKLHPGDQLTGRVLQLEADGRVLIDLGGFRALARTDIAVRPGQVLALKVLQNGMPLYLRLDADVLSAQAAAERPLPCLMLNDILAPEIQQDLMQMIDRLTAADPSAAKAAAQPAAIPGMPQIVRHALAQLKTFFEPLAIDAPVQQQTQWVRAAVEENGVFFEARLANVYEALQLVGKIAAPTDAAALWVGKITAPLENDAIKRVRAGDIQNTADPALPSAPSEPLSDPLRKVLGHDLKAQLLILKSFLDQADQAAAEPAGLKSKDAQVLRQSVNQLLGHVEQQQERAVQRAGDQTPFQVFAHSWQLKDQHQSVRLKVYFPRKGKGSAGDGQQHRVAVLLQMDRLGPVRADLAMLGRNLNISFFVCDQTVRQVFMTQSTAVADALKGFFEEVYVDTFVSSAKIDAFEDEDLLGLTPGRINIQV